MKKNLRLTVVAMAAVCLLAGACKGPKVTDEEPEIPQPRTSVPDTPPPGGEAPAQAPQRAILDDEVSTHWKGVEVTVVEAEGEGSYAVEIPLGGEAAVEGTPLTIRLLGFVPDFAMNADTIGTKSLDDVNPAAKIEISEEGKVLFSGWSFRDHPDMHAFEDPRYEVKLTRAIPKE